ncbi:hypothetical protein PV08_01108 [Exophiala spinifera]|uniref:Uncharacterized protein n=1 Tax=Exophiala spinifera TaxID=91928 RepID=A0A0D2BNS1_9EURO|nr:uncharacterized protein PV08_01108 [Exophiala spinifera]KIW20533.1 hypothetical protein PV08_01108 [Exophiala spinifera]
MISPSPIVPSKNALRALRRLALSPPAVVVVGAVGSLCGAAVVHCEIRRQLVLAERIIETKKVLRSLTNGPPAERLKDMFEAAERGEDVTSPEWRAKRRRKEIGRRSFSTSSRTSAPAGNDYGGTKETSMSREEERKTPSTQKPIKPRYHPIPRLYLGKHVSRSREKREPSFTEFRFSSQRTNAGPLNSNRRLLANQHYNTTSQKHINNSCFPTGSPDGNLAGPSLQHGSMRPTLREGDSDTSVERSRDKSASGLLDGEPGIHNPSAKYDSVTSLPFRPLYVLPRQSSTEGSPCSMDRECDVATKPAPAAPSTSKDLRELPRKELRWHHGRRLWSSCTTNKANTIDLDTALDTEFTSYRKRVQSYGPHWPKRTRVFESPKLETGIDELKYIPYSIRNHFTKSVNPKVYLDVQNFISPRKHVSTYEGRLQRWSAAMRYYTHQKDPNWAMAEALFFSWRFSFRPEDLICAPVMKLISYLLATAPTSERLQELFFPSSVPGDSTDHHYSLAPRYLAIFCEGHDEKSCIAELAKIHKLAKRSKLAHKDQVFVPVLRKALRNQDPGQRDDLINAVVEVYGEAVRPYILSQCALLYTSSGDWVDVQETLSQIHATGHSRQRVYQYSLVFNSILKRHLETNGAAQAFDFLLGCIKDAGLVPLRSISTTIICALVQEKRFDLVSEWVRLVREAFPRCKLGFDLEEDAWKLGQALRTIGATCQQVAEVCRGISLGCRDDPFSPVLKDFVKDIVRHDVTGKFHTLAEHRPSLVALDTYLQWVPLSQVIDVASRICTSHRPPVSGGDVFDSALQDLASQLNGIEELKSIFAGDLNLARPKSVGDYQSDASSRGISSVQDSWRSSSTAESQLLISELIERAELIDIVYIQDMVAEHYDMQQADGYAVNHLLLERLLVRLASNRPWDALKLVETFYARHYAQCLSGKGLGNGLFLKWMSLVLEIGDNHSTLEVLWAILDSSSQLEWSFEFTALVDIVGRSFTPSTTPEEPRELNYLMERIRVLKKTVREPKSVNDDFTFPPWRDWEEDLRDTINLPKVPHLAEEEEMLEARWS